MPRTRFLRVAGAVAVAAGAITVARDPRLQRRLRRASRSASIELRRARGLARGLEYRASGREPDPMVDDRTLADRIRSELGRLERQLDVPRVHVTVRHHVASLHGEVISETDVEAIERRVLQVAGVWGVRSFLHVGLASGDTPPSVGRTTGVPSELLTELLDGASRWGLGGVAAQRALRAVLATLAERLPEEERRHLGSHLPADVRAMLRPPRVHGHGWHHRVRDVDEFLSIVADTSGVEKTAVAPLAEAVLGTLRDRVPEEATDVAAVLPASLRRWWEVAVPA